MDYNWLGPYEIIKDVEKGFFKMNTLIKRFNVDILLYFCRYPYCQAQHSSSYCGVFALAFAYIIAEGEDHANYMFNKSGMCNHILKCIEDNKMMDFPITRYKEKRRKHLYITSFSIYCICRMYQFYQLKLVECSGCMGRLPLNYRHNLNVY